MWSSTGKIPDMSVYLSSFRCRAVSDRVRGTGWAPELVTRKDRSRFRDVGLRVWRGEGSRFEEAVSGSGKGPSRVDRGANINSESFVCLLPW